MPLVTRRAKGNAEVIIDHELCNLCGLCVQVCKGPLFRILPWYIQNAIRIKAYTY
ncbi:MAG: 4Fe-4S binding protein [Syntrophomonadaceae bacterium]|jgi:ferredoxin|nr:4Fe-4S binding protein [Bacillota bacterium]NLP25510.1 4Fe-4S binding protein [Syntrophomonadaceae bacterium]NMB02367.1 4Fe-4S binding protein [Bacillota bacterium]